jgi:hypothetical protein
VKDLSCESNLLEIVGTARPTSRFTSGLNSGQKQPDQDANDGNNNEKLHEREARTTFHDATSKSGLQ